MSARWRAPEGTTGRKPIRVDISNDTERRKLRDARKYDMIGTRRDREYSRTFEPRDILGGEIQEATHTAQKLGYTGSFETEGYRKSEPFVLNHECFRLS